MCYKKNKVNLVDVPRDYPIDNAAHKTTIIQVNVEITI
jgi:hypothetical protein